MIEYKSVTNANGDMVAKCVMIKDNLIQYYNLKDGELLVTREVDGMVNPFWNGNEWVETATEEEMKYYYEHLLD